MLERMPGNLLRLSFAPLLAAEAIACAVPAGAAATTPAAYVRAVTQICAHARLFEGTYAVGTRAGALQLGRDIRDSTQRRLARVAGLSAPRSEQEPVTRWLALEQHLAEAYALAYVRIYDLIAEPRTTAGQSARAALRLARLPHAPDRLRRVATVLERRLRVPDCTGGTAGGARCPRQSRGRRDIPRRTGQRAGVSVDICAGCRQRCPRPGA
jgi:hypothetical protein